MPKNVEGGRGEGLRGSKGRTIKGVAVRTGGREGLSLTSNQVVACS